jgi:transcriptional regulator with XRE-family HTH domain
MATGTVYTSTRVSGLMHDRYARRVAAQPDSPSSSEPRPEFSQVVKDAREQRGWNQDQLAEAAGVSRPTIQRWESAKTGAPDPENARKVFLALGLDPRLIPVILGYVTPEEMGLPPQVPRVFAPTVEQAIRILEDPAVPAAAKHEWIEFLQFRANQAVDAASRQAG